MGADAAGAAATAQANAIAASDTAGAAATVQGNLTTHTGLTTTAHGGIVGSGDSRLSDARTPVSHDNTKHSTGVAAGASAPGDAALEGSSASVARADHKHSREAFGTAAGTVCQGNDSRLSDSRTPAAHAATHVTGGGDTIANVASGGNAGLMTGSDKSSSTASLRAPPWRPRRLRL